MALTAASLGARSDQPAEVRWTESDILLYAIAVGAGQEDPLRELELTTENSEGVTLRALPSYAGILVGAGRPNVQGLDRRTFVHLGQSISLSEPVPTSGTAHVSTEIVGVLDKGTDAILITEQLVRSADDGRELAIGRETLLVRGGGGFGGERGGRGSDAILHGKPDHTVMASTRRDQALLYRLTGDHNPIHTDPVTAERAGFPRPILHGMCTLGFATRLVIEYAFDGDSAAVASIECRFTTAVYPGDRLELQIWERDGDAAFRVLVDGRIAIDGGHIRRVAA